MKYIFVSALLALQATFAHEAVAQVASKDANETKKETVIIRKQDGTDAQTVVEVKDGEVFINGEKMAAKGDLGNKKIIIDSDNDIRIEDKSKPAKHRPMLGVYTAATENNNGVSVESVSAGSSAEKAGLKKGDIITTIDGKAIKTPKELVAAINTRANGDEVRIGYRRNNQNKEAKTTLDKAPSDFLSMDLPNINLDDIPNPFDEPFFEDLKNEIFKPTPKLGITAEERTDGNGVRIASIEPNTAASKAGLQKEDIITTLNGKKIASIEQLTQALQTAETNKNIPVQYLRNGKAYNTSLYFSKPLKHKDL